MKQVIYLFLLVCLCHTFVTVEEQPTNNKTVLPKLNISTKCNAIDLSSYNYTGIAKSGYLSVGKGNSALTFIFYGRSGVTNPGDLNNYPTLIWLNGGPGESSQWGNFNEMGPLTVRRKLVGTGLEVVVNKNSWNREYNLLFIDQPVGTGLSYADPDFKNVFPTTTAQVAQDFYEALNQLYNNQNGCFNSAILNIRASSPLFIFGQEYAGKFAPAIGSLIMQNKDKGGFLTGLKGVAIADGLTNPYDILSEIGNYAYHMSLIDYQERTIVEQMLINITISFESRDFERAHGTFKRILDYIVSKSGNINVFNYNKYGNYEDIVSEFFHASDIITKFNLNPQIKFGMQADQIFMSLYNDYMRSEAHQVENLLNKGVAVLVYTGQDNLKVHAPGTMKWVDRLYFNDAENFQKGILNTWKVNNKIAGTVKSAGNLELRIVFNAGRYVAADQPQNAFDMIRSWVNGHR